MLRLISAILLVLLGIALSGGSSDLANPITRWAEAQQIQQDTKRQAAQDAIDLPLYAKVQEAQTKAAVTEIETNTQYQKDLAAQKLQHAQRSDDLRLQLFRLGGYGGLFALLVISIGVSVYIARRAPVNKTPLEQWRPVRLEAQKREQEQREERIRTRTRLEEQLAPVTVGSNGSQGARVSSYPSQPMQPWEN
jgi:ABC-type multidrug transport system fused ATPase/permease subunit